ncbi:MAG: sugar phosphate isomerase/epimerase [Acidobacteria bacterium]|nr:sugar phosphate isomerase/epimerase [Acidobacteriota bacterium]
MNQNQSLSRRAVLAAGAIPLAAQPALTGLIGVTTGSFMPHLKSGDLVLLDLPRIMRDELGLKVLDLMTATLASLDRPYCERLRNEAIKAGILITNLKMNQPGLDLSSADPTVRAQAIKVYKETIDLAAVLGCRWVRPLPGPKRPDLKLVATSYHELMDYAAPKKIALLVENYGWMMDDPDALPSVIRAVGRGLKAQPDTGNFSDAARYAGLEKAFPHAVSCDFKAFQFGPGNSHPKYDLKRCFDVAWKAGFRGPWCFEHFNEKYKPLLAGMAALRDMIRMWTAEARKAR